MDLDEVPQQAISNVQITLNSFDQNSIIGIVILMFLLLLSGFISGSEIAFFSLTPNDKEDLNKSDKKVNKTILKLISIPEKLLATILVANNFINVAIIVLSTFLVNTTFDFTQTPILGFLIEIVSITFIILLFGEIIPKIYATNYPSPFAKIMARPINALMHLFMPINLILIQSTSLVNKRLQKKAPNISINEISQALELTSEKELSDDKNILEGIVKFGNISVNQIMRSRVDVVALELSESFDHVLNVINDSGFSRIPVYSENFDQVSGILYIKDLIPHIHKGSSFKWQTLTRSPYYVPENKKIDDLLQEFQKSKVHMAIVVDEYGGTSGIVTLEDVLEEIVGEIADEFDEDDRLYTKIAENEFLFDGKISINDFCKIVDYKESFLDKVRGDADTVAGLLLELKGDFPNIHEKIEFAPFVFSIEAIDQRRIKKIQVKINKKR